VEHLDATTSPDNEVAILGDWNIAPDDRDVWDTAAFEGATHVTDLERNALTAVVDWGFTDTMRKRYDDAGIYSYYDYQAGRFHKREGIRIDLVFASASLAERSVLDVVDRNGRKGTKPSDHCPVLAGFGARS
jgi:exodeoxyribonuclease-3